MMQVQKTSTKLNSLLESSGFFLNDLLGYKPEQTNLQEIPEDSWDEFTQSRGFNSNSSGIYLPRNQTAIVRGENPLSLFHEYFGHGLYCEQSLIGKKLVNLEKQLLMQEREEFKEKNFTLDEVRSFRKKSSTFKDLEELRQRFLGTYELSAIWVEYLLSKELELRNDFESKYSKFTEKDQKAISSIIDFSRQYGNLATFYSFGFARITTPERARKLLKDIYRDKVNDIKFALLYGSRKEFSDIDIFVVGDCLERIRNKWIDVSVYSSEEFAEKVNLFDVEVTDPLFNGEFLFGSKEQYKESRNKLLKQPINIESIVHNLQLADSQEKFALEYPLDSEQRRIGLNYAKTFKLMAQNLKAGRRLFTKDDLISHSIRASAEDEKPLQLQGGIKNAT